MKRKSYRRSLGIVLTAAILCVGCGSSSESDSDGYEDAASDEVVEAEDDSEFTEDTDDSETKSETDSEAEPETEEIVENEESEEVIESNEVTVQNTFESASQYEGTFAVGYDHIIVLMEDGTVISEESGRSKHDAGESEVDDWDDIVYIDAGSNVSVGLKSDGTVVSAGGYDTGGMDWYIDRYNVSEWTDVIYVAAGDNNIIAITGDGSVLIDGQISSVIKSEVQEWTDVEDIALYDDCIIGLMSDGTVAAIGSNKYGECDTDDWSEIIEIATGSTHTVGLKSDGTVVAVGNNEDSQCDVEDWTDIVSIAACENCTFGLKSDGTLEIAGLDSYDLFDAQEWTGIIAIDAHCGNVAGLKSDGTVVIAGVSSRLSDTININEGYLSEDADDEDEASESGSGDEATVVTAEIIKAAAVDEESGVQRYATSIAMTSDGITAAIRADGTVAYTGSGLDDEDDVYAVLEDWTDIVALAAGDYFIIGLKLDGTVVAAENSSYRFFEVSVADELNDWSDIVMIAACGAHALGLKSDGTVLAAGSNDYGESDVEDWSGIVMLAVADNHSLGLTVTGEIVAVGKNTNRQCEISSSSGKEFVSIAAGAYGSFAISSSGGITSYGDPDINSASDPVCIYACSAFALALQADGTLSSSNAVIYQGISTDEWADVVELTGQSVTLLGRQADGTVIKSTSGTPLIIWTGKELGY